MLMIENNSVHADVLTEEELSVMKESITEKYKFLMEKEGIKYFYTLCTSTYTDYFKFCGIDHYHIDSAYPSGYSDMRTNRDLFNKSRGPFWDYRNNSGGIPFYFSELIEVLEGILRSILSVRISVYQVSMNGIGKYPTIDKIAESVTVNNPGIKE